MFIEPRRMLENPYKVVGNECDDENVYTTKCLPTDMILFATHTYICIFAVVGNGKKETFTVFWFMFPRKVYIVSIMFYGALL